MKLYTVQFGDKPRCRSRKRAVDIIYGISLLDTRLKRFLKLWRQALESWNRFVPAISLPPESRIILVAI